MCNTGFAGTKSQEAGQVAVVRSLSSQKQDRSRRVVEPELDMNRFERRASATGRIIDLVRWLMPFGRDLVGTPKRSVERELEEVWPSHE
jgi:hypothetical protein